MENPNKLPVSKAKGIPIALDRVSLKSLENTLIKDGEIQILPASEWTKYGKNTLALFLITHNLWVAPTLELIDILDDEIGDMSCIEICAGQGIISKELNIRATDSYLHASEEYKQAIGNDVITYPEHVEKLEASEAVDKYHPECVLGCYAVPKWKWDKASDYFDRYKKDLRGSVKGVDYDYIMPRINKLILVGYGELYNQHTFFKRPHKCIVNKGIITRHTIEGRSAIYIFNK